MENQNEIMQDSAMTKAIQQIHVVQGSVHFGAYHELKKQAEQLAEQIASVEVTEDNVKVSKKLLAEVNKRIKMLEDKRISIKRVMLEPYQEFDEQVKEIVGIVKNSDALVRQQVKTMEENERIDKENAINDLFHKRIQLYSFKDIIPFMDFVKPKHLNKTTSMQAIEKEMVHFFEKVEKDLNVLYQMPEVDNHINAYLNTYDLGEAMTIVKREKERKEQIVQARKKSNKIDQINVAYQFVVFSEKDANFVELFLQSNNIKFEKQEG